jgi:hypothetical protein
MKFSFSELEGILKIRTVPKHWFLFLYNVGVCLLLLECGLLTGGTILSHMWVEHAVAGRACSHEIMFIE